MTSFAARFLALGVGHLRRRDAATALWLVVTLTADAPVRYATSRSTSSTDRSAASPACRCCARSAACCRPTGCSRRCRPICSDKLPGGYASFGFIVEPGTTCRSASRGAAGSASIRSASTARCATPAPCATRRRAAADRARHAGAPARPPGVRAVRARLHARQPADRRRRPRPASRRDGGPSLFERLLLRTGLIDRLKLQTLEPAQPHRAGARATSAPMGPRPRRHVQSVQGDPVQLGSRPSCRASELIGASDFPSLWNQTAARGHAAALGRRQRLGRRAQPERGARRRRHARDRRSRGDQARARLDLDAAAAEVSLSDRRRRSPRAAQRSTQQHCRRCHADHRFRDGVDARRRASARWSRSIGIGTDPPSARLVHVDVRREPVRAVSGLARIGSRTSGRRDGYANHPLDGIWLRGAVSCTTDRCRRCATCSTRRTRRPAVFYRGYDVFDQMKVGFVSNVPGRRTQRSRATTRRCRATATADTCTARRCPTRTSDAHRRVHEDVLKAARSTVMINDTTRTDVVQARDVARHCRQPRAGPADAAGAATDDGVRRPADGHAAPLDALRGAAADPAQRVLHAGRCRPRPLSPRRVAHGRRRGWPAWCSSSARSRGVPHVRLLRPRCSSCRRRLLLLVAISGAAGR